MTLDELARALASPMPRRRALGLGLGALVATAVPAGLRPTRARASAEQACGRGGKTCAQQFGASAPACCGAVDPSDPQSNYWCCKTKGDCCRGTELLGGLCCDREKGTICKDGACVTLCPDEKQCGKTCCKPWQDCVNEARGLCCPQRSRRAMPVRTTPLRVAPATRSAASTLRRRPPSAAPKRASASRRRRRVAAPTAGSRAASARDRSAARPVRPAARASAAPRARRTVAMAPAARQRRGSAAGRPAARRRKTSAALERPAARRGASASRKSVARARGAAQPSGSRFRTSIPSAARLAPSQFRTGPPNTAARRTTSTAAADQRMTSLPWFARGRCAWQTSFAGSGPRRDSRGLATVSAQPSLAGLTPVRLLAPVAPHAGARCGRVLSLWLLALLGAASSFGCRAMSRRRSSVRRRAAASASTTSPTS